jgi:transcriptional accessory protein Tex/SPT6
MSELPFIELEDLVILFRYANRESARLAIERGVFPVEVYLLNGSYVADREVVRQFFKWQREKGLASLNKKIKKAEAERMKRVENYEKMREKAREYQRKYKAKRRAKAKAASGNSESSPPPPMESEENKT